MLAYERRVVAALLSTDDPGRRRAVEDHVSGALAAMPEIIRLGIAGETVALGAWSTVRHRGRVWDGQAEVAWLDGHPIGLVRQWLRALRSLVLFAEQEMLSAATDGAGPSGIPSALASP